MTQITKINRVPRLSRLIIQNLHVMFESDWTKSVFGIVPTAQKVLCIECQSWPLTTQPKINRVTPLINNWRVVWKWWGKNVVFILPTRFHSLSVKVDLWPRNPKSIGFLLIINNIYVNFESDWAKTVVCIMSRRWRTMDGRMHLPNHTQTAWLYPFQHHCEGIINCRWQVVINKPTHCFHWTLCHSFTQKEQYLLISAC